jgi:hypothetical protein
MKQMSIIQSSGSGKSRLVDEVARHIFTIPFNLRPKSETQRETFAIVCFICCLIRIELRRGGLSSAG